MRGKREEGEKKEEHGSSLIRQSYWRGREKGAERHHHVAPDLAAANLGVFARKITPGKPLFRRRLASLGPAIGQKRLC